MTRLGKRMFGVLRNIEPRRPGPASRSGAEQGMSHVWKRRFHRSYPVGLARRSNRHRRLLSEVPPPGETPTGSFGSREGFEPTGRTEPGRPPERTPPPRHPIRRNRSKAPRPEATISPTCSGTDARPEPQGTRPKAPAPGKSPGKGAPAPEPRPTRRHFVPRRRPRPRASAPARGPNPRAIRPRALRQVGNTTRRNLPGHRHESSHGFRRDGGESGELLEGHRSWTERATAPRCTGSGNPGTRLGLDRRTGLRPDSDAAVPGISPEGPAPTALQATSELRRGGGRATGTSPEGARRATIHVVTG
jgi:hypothetical protein